MTQTSQLEGRLVSSLTQPPAAPGYLSPQLLLAEDDRRRHQALVRKVTDGQCGETTAGSRTGGCR